MPDNVTNWQRHLLDEAALGLSEDAALPVSILEPPVGGSPWRVNVGGRIRTLHPDPASAHHVMRGIITGYRLAAVDPRSPANTQVATGMVLRTERTMIDGVDRWSVWLNPEQAWMANADGVLNERIARLLPLTWVSLSIRASHIIDVWSL